MALAARVERVDGRMSLVINDTPTSEFWCFGWPNALPDFRAAGLRICQFDLPQPSWWTGPPRTPPRPAAWSIISGLMKRPFSS